MWFALAALSAGCAHGVAAENTAKPDRPAPDDGAGEAVSHASAAPGDDEEGAAPASREVVAPIPPHLLPEGAELGSSRPVRIGHWAPGWLCLSLPNGRLTEIRSPPSAEEIAGAVEALQNTAEGERVLLIEPDVPYRAAAEFIDALGDAGIDAISIESRGMGSCAIRRTIRSSLPRVRYCYEAQLAHQPELEGQVVVLLTIAPQTGQVIAAAIDEASTLHSEPVTACILDSMRKLQFPAAREGERLNVRYPFSFRPTPGQQPDR
jgi:hypothetical protein